MMSSINDLNVSCSQPYNIETLPLFTHTPNLPYRRCPLPWDYKPLTSLSLLVWQAFNEYEQAMGTIEHMWSLPMGSQVPQYRSFSELLYSLTASLIPSGLWYCHLLF